MAKKKHPTGCFFICAVRLTLQRGWQVRLDSGQYSFEAFGVTGNDVAFFKEIVAASEIADQAARFLNQRA